METRVLGGILEKYLALFPGEIHDLALLKSQVGADEDLVGRGNFTGHVTASGVILSRDRTRAIVIFHPQLQRYLHPGGHMQSDDASPFDAAMRAIIEETGIARVVPLDFTGDSLPLDIDTHYIPVSADPRGNPEPSHYHHDFRYVFTVDEAEAAQAQGRGTLDWKWMPIEEFEKLVTLREATNKVRLFSQEHRPSVFLQSLITKPIPGLLQRETENRMSVFVVSHIIPNRSYFFRALANMATIAGVIPKKNSADSDTYARLSALYPFLSVSKENLRSTSSIEADMIRVPGRIVLLDIGGYFAPIINELAHRFGEKIVGVIEDTENGHQKYKALPELHAPVISVARSPLKENEDYLVGQSIVSAAEFVLRDFNRLLNFQRIGVIGYGKIGSSISTHLSRAGIESSVYDSDPLRRVAAINRGHLSPEKENIVSQSDLLFCATGNYALVAEDFQRLKTGALVVSVTSSDDELDLTETAKAYQHAHVSKYVTKYYNDQHYFYLVNNGNAVNFISKTVAGDFIYLVQAEILAALQHISHTAMQPGIYEMSQDVRREIARRWLETWNQ